MGVICSFELYQIQTVSLREDIKKLNKTKNLFLPDKFLYISPNVAYVSFEKKIIL